MEEAMAHLLSEGAVALDLVLNRTSDQKLALRELRGQPVVLCFYPADGDQLTIYDEILDRFGRHTARASTPLGTSTLFRRQSKTRARRTATRLFRRFS
jgi:peroxiredoxin